MILVVYFDVFIEDLKKRLLEHDIAYEVVKYADLEHYTPPERIRHVIIAGSKRGFCGAISFRCWTRF